MLWIRMEKRKVVERRNESVFRTEVVGSEWFACGSEPEAYAIDENDEMWTNTNDCVVRKERPT